MIALALLVLGVVMAAWLRQPPPPEPQTPAVRTEDHRRIASNVLHSVSSATVAEVLRIEAEEAEVARTIWGKEMLAQECGRPLERLWDAINAATNTADRWEVVTRFHVGELVPPKWDTEETKPHEIQLFQSTVAGPLFTQEEWSGFLRSIQAGGWLLEQVEIRQTQFEPSELGVPVESRFWISAHLKNERERAQVEGDILVQWGERDAEGGFQIKRVDASGITLKKRAGEPVFKLALNEEIVPQGQSRILDPLILYDLNQDGLSEIILAGRNLVYRNRGNFRFEGEPLCKFPEEFLSTALIADFDGDGHADFLGKKWEGLFLFKGSADGKFEHKPVLAWKPEKPLQKPMVMTCGDIDADGDLDLFIGQYKEPYEGGATPKPFYDADDGEPAYVLFNNGAGIFRDGTEACGLTGKRHRRAYSASFADLDGDHDLDLAVVSDFAGLDLYSNQGKGQFTDVTPARVTNAKAFGMALTLNDFNNDGRIDLLMIGMTSPTADRLNHLELWRDDPAEERPMRQEMTHGNRLYLNEINGKFAETALSATVARTGWSWGCTAFDLEDDGWVDLYIGNGLESNASVTEYDSEYWLHDKYVGLTNAGSATDLYFKSKFSRTRGRTHSYGGHEKNRFFLNLRGKEFLEAGYLMGVALPEDSRNVVSDDLDGDGKTDLAVMTFEIWPRAKQSLKVFRNSVATSGNWTGIRFSSNAGKAWPGAAVRLFHAGGETIRHIVTGDSYRSQHAPKVRFGLGTNTLVDRVEIHRVGKPIQKLQPSTLNRYINVND